MPACLELHKLELNTQVTLHRSVTQSVKRPHAPIGRPFVTAPVSTLLPHSVLQSVPTDHIHHPGRYVLLFHHY